MTKKKEFNWPEGCKDCNDNLICHYIAQGEVIECKKRNKYMILGDYRNTDINDFKE